MPSTPAWYSRWWTALLKGLRAPDPSLGPPMLGAPGIFWPQHGDASAYAALYKVQPHVRTVVDFLAMQLGQLGIHVFRRLSDTDRVRVNDHPLALLLKSPNEGTTRAVWLGQMVHDLGVFGNAYSVKLRPQNRLSLYRVPAGQMQAHGDLLPRVYTWALGDGRVLTLDAADVFHLRLYNPDDAVMGLSPLETLRRTLAEETAATEYRAWFWQNGAKLSGWIARPKEAPRWTPEQREQFRTEWRAFQGPANAGKSPVLEDGMEFNPVNMTARDAELIEARKLTREEVAAAYHVPPAMIGILEAQGYGSLREQHRALYQDTLGPLIALWEGEIERQLLSEFSDDDVYVQFNINEKLQGSFEEEVTAMSSAVGSPWMSRNEARARQNLPRVNEQAFDVPVTRLDIANANGEVVPIRDRAETAGVLIRAGFAPDDVLRIVGLPPMEHLGMPPVTVQPEPSTAAPTATGPILIPPDLEPFAQRLEHALRALPEALAAQLPPPAPSAAARRFIRGTKGHVVAVEDRTADGDLIERRVPVRDDQGRVTDLVPEEVS